MTDQLSLLLLICAIIIVIVLFILFWFILKIQDESIAELQEIVRKNHSDYNKSLSLNFNRIKNEIEKLKSDTEEFKINITKKIDDLIEFFKKQDQIDSVNKEIREIRNQLAKSQFNIALKEPISAHKEDISRIPQIHGVKSETSSLESNLIADFNWMLVNSDYEKDFRTRYQFAPAFCNSNGMIILMVTADEENLWIIPRSDHDNAVVLPSRRLLTKFLSTLLSNKGEGASTLIGGAFDVAVRDDLERARLKRFAEAEIERNATGQIINAHIFKKGQLELPSGKS